MHPKAPRGRRVRSGHDVGAVSVCRGYPGGRRWTLPIRPRSRRCARAWRVHGPPRGAAARRLAARGRGGRLAALDDRAAEAAGQGRGPVEPVPARPARGRARHAPDQPRVRAARRDHGPRVLGLGDLQLLGARYRQHGAVAPVRHARAARGLAGPAARGRDPFLLRHDRARRRELRCDQHRHPDRARRASTT